MKKQSQFAILLLLIIAIAIVVLAAGLVGLQKLTSLSKAAHDEYTKTLKHCQDIEDALAKKSDLEDELAYLEARLSSIDKDLVNYEYIPTYLEQLQRTAKQTGNTIISIRPRPIESLDTGNPLLKASHEAWQKDHPPLKSIELDEKPAEPKAASPGATKEKPKSNYRIQQYTLEIEGDYVSLMRVLEALSDFPKLVYVRTINVSPRNRTEPDQLTARLETYAIIIPEQYHPVKPSPDTTAERMAP
jgi:Tfp pilus assembly protein PilO